MKREENLLEAVVAGAGGYAGDPALACLLAKIWEVQATDTARLRSLCDAAVCLARQLDDARGRGWAHLTRALYAADERPLVDSLDDLAAAQAWQPGCGDARSARLLEVAGAGLMLKQGDYEAAYERFMALGVRTGGPDDADDFFVLCGQAAAALPLGHIEQAFSALYANLVLSERGGPPVRHCLVATQLARTLIAIERPAEAIEMLEHLIFTVGLPSTHPALWLQARHSLARARLLAGHADEALNDLQEIAEHPGSRERVALDESLAAACLQLGRLDAAQRHLDAALQRAQRLQQPAPLGACHLLAGRLHHARGEFDTAIAQLEQAVACLAGDAASRICDPAAAQASQWLAEYHAAAGDFERAYLVHRNTTQLQQQRSEFVSRGQQAATKAKQSVWSSIQLTERELECLSWCAAGKTAWETGQILDISEWTVVYHLEKAKRKFGLTRKQQVIARAMSLGLITGLPNATRP